MPLDVPEEAKRAANTLAKILNGTWGPFDQTTIKGVFKNARYPSKTPTTEEADATFRMCLLIVLGDTVKSAPCTASARTGHAWAVRTMRTHPDRLHCCIDDPFAGVRRWTSQAAVVTT